MKQVPSGTFVYVKERKNIACFKQAIKTFAEGICLNKSTSNVTSSYPGQGCEEVHVLL